MKTIAIGDGFHEEGNFNAACFLLPPFQGEIQPPAMRVVVDLTVRAAAKPAIKIQLFFGQQTILL